MGSRAFDAHVSPTERTVPNDPERTIAAPRFDEKSVQRARPAVPLTLRARAGRWPLAVVVTCVLAGLAGGMLGGIALMKYQAGRSRAVSDSAATTDPTRGADGDSARTADAGEQPVADQQPPAAQPASDAAQARQQSQTQPTADGEGTNEAQGEGAEPAPSTREELRAALGGWVAATNARDVGRQMEFYAPTVGSFYLSRNASRESVRAEKARVFAQARAVEVAASEPDIRVGGDGRSAVMRFRKRYQIDGRGGEVLQELRWRRTPSGWRIVGERDLRVIQ